MLTHGQAEFLNVIGDGGDIPNIDMVEEICADTGRREKPLGHYVKRVVVPRETYEAIDTASTLQQQELDFR